MTPENRAEILHRFFHASKQQAKAIAAEISPREAAPHRALVTAVGPVSCARPAIGAARASGSPPTAPPEAFALSQSFRPGETPLTQASVAKARPAVSAPAPAPRSTTEPLTANLRRLHVTVSKRFLAKLDAARDALSHSHPGVDVETILEVGLELVIERHAKRKGLVAKPRAMPPPHLDPLPSGGGGDDESPCRLPVQGEASRYIPAHVKREVWIRDQGCCQWKLAGGGICGSTVRLQFDHILPVARGGTSTVSNTRILCAIHNRIAARRVFGDALMDRFVPKRPSAALLDSR